jgi:8-oxo-dGTP diphosphatase
MDRTEKTELTVLCLIQKDGKILLQNRVKTDWQGYAFPGGHIEVGESIVDAVVREVREETGLTIYNPALCGVKQFPLKDGKYENGRYLVFLFRADQFTGEVTSSDEGEMRWIAKDELHNYNLVQDFDDMLKVMATDDYTEFQYIVENDEWRVMLK